MGHNRGGQLSEARLITARLPPFWSGRGTNLPHVLAAHNESYCGEAVAGTLFPRQKFAAPPALLGRAAVRPAAAKTAMSTYRWLDLTPLGRQRHVTEFPYHDTYDPEP